MDECPSIQNNIGKRNIFHIFRYGANKLIKGPKVLLDRSLVERYFQGEDSEEERRKEAEKERKRKKASYYNRMKNRPTKTQSQGQSQRGRPRKALYASGSAPAIMEGLLNNKRSPSKNNFNCNICKKPYKYLGALHQHMRRDHGQGPSGKKFHGSFKQNGIDFDKDVVLLDTDGKFMLEFVTPFTYYVDLFR